MNQSAVSAEIKVLRRKVRGSDIYREREREREREIKPAFLPKRTRIYSMLLCRENARQVHADSLVSNSIDMESIINSGYYVAGGGGGRREGGKVSSAIERAGGKEQTEIGNVNISLIFIT